MNSNFSTATRLDERGWKSRCLDAAPECFLLYNSLNPIECILLQVHLIIFAIQLRLCSLRELVGRGHLLDKVRGELIQGIVLRVGTALHQRELYQGSIST